MNHLKALALVLAVTVVPSAFAAGQTMADRSELEFLAEAGMFVKQVAPHLYRIEKNGAVRHLAFGRPAVDELNAKILANMQKHDPVGAQRFSEQLSAHDASAKYSYSPYLCSGGLQAHLSADATPGMSYHSAHAGATLNFIGLYKNDSYLGQVFAWAKACVPKVEDGSPDCDNNGQTQSDGTSSVLTSSNTMIRVNNTGTYGGTLGVVTATTQWPSFMFSRLESYASATCGFFDTQVAYTCVGDDPHYNSCP